MQRVLLHIAKVGRCSWKGSLFFFQRSGHSSCKGCPYPLLDRIGRLSWKGSPFLFQRKRPLLFERVFLHIKKVGCCSWKGSPFFFQRSGRYSSMGLPNLRLRSGCSFCKGCSFT